MPLGISEGNPMAIAAMGERYGDRLVSQLAQAGGMIENGLKQVTTMKELQSLGQNLSQISPESPDYQQKLMQLGAAHPFAMQDPRGQALINMGNQQHLQWQHQQYAMQAADRADARATRHDDMAYRRAVAVAGMRMKAGEQELDPLTEVTPQPGFSNSVGLSIDQTQEAPDDNATNLPVNLRMPGDDMSDLQIPASLTRRGISMEDGQDAASRIPSVTDPEAQVERTAPRDLTEAEMLNNRVAAGERVIGGPPNAKIRMGLVKQFGGIGAKEEAALARNDFRREMFDKTQAAKDDFAAKQNALKDQAAAKRHQYVLDETKYRLDNAAPKTSESLKREVATKSTIYTDAMKTTGQASESAMPEAIKREEQAKAEYYEALGRLDASGARKQGGGSTEKGWKISPNNPNWEINDETKQVRPKK